MYREVFCVLFTIWTIGTSVLVVGAEGEGEGKDEDDGVVSLEDGTFDHVLRVTAQDGEVWLVEFYAPWCSYCVKFKKHLPQLSSELQGKARVGIVNVDRNQDVTERYGVEYLPCFLIFGKDKGNPKKYTGKVTMPDLRYAVLQEVQSMKGTP